MAAPGTEIARRHRSPPVPWALVSRTVTLALVDGAGAVSGALPPYRVPAPWWQDAREVVAGARERFGLAVVVLRLLSAERTEPHGGAVRYLAELAGPAPDPALLRPASDDLSPHPARAPWAVPGGPSRSVDWAVGMLDGMAGGPVRAMQERTWNLSAIWWFDRRDGSGTGPVGWLKQVPPFFAHEATVLRWLGEQFPGLAPRVRACRAIPGVALDLLVGWRGWRYRSFARRAGSSGPPSRPLGSAGRRRRAACARYPPGTDAGRSPRRGGTRDAQ